MLHLHSCLKLIFIRMRGMRKNDPSHNNRIFESSATSGMELALLPPSLGDNSMDSWSRCIQGEGQTFKDAAEFRRCIKNYAVAIRRTFLYEKNTSQKVSAVCSDINYKWRIYVSLHKGDKLFGIRKCNLEHTCGVDNLRSRGTS